MNVVHISVTPLAGSPIRIVNALNRHTEIRAALIVRDPGAYGRRVFAGGFHWHAQREECLELLHNADILHLHHYFPLDGTHNPFEFDFTSLKARPLRHFHSHPLTIAGGDVCKAKTIISDPIPSLVIAQYPERGFPRARVVPNVVPVNDPAYRPIESSGANLSIAFSPSIVRSAWETPVDGSRFDTKGLPETLQLMENLQRRHEGLELRVMSDLPHEECLRRKQTADLAIDDLVTGSYHLSSLESLAMGKPTFCFLDRRIEQILGELTGSHDLPWVNVRLELAEPFLERFLEDSVLREAIGRESRRWMETHWNDALLVRHFVAVYADLLERPELFETPRFAVEDISRTWFLSEQYDLEWRARKALYESSRGKTLLGRIGNFFRSKGDSV